MSAALLEEAAPLAISQPAGLTDATGARRRLRALAYRGWSARAAAVVLNVSPELVRAVRSGRAAVIPPGLAAAVSNAYDLLWDMRGASPVAAANAARQGWCPPLAWDDDADDGHGIDDPRSVPADWRPRRPTAADRLEDAAELMAAGHTLGQAAWRLDVTPHALHKLIRRAHVTGGAR